MPSNMGFKTKKGVSTGAATGLWGLPPAYYSHQESRFVQWKSVPSRDWSCEEWVAYHKDLKKKTGKRNANTNLIKAWRYFGNVGNSSGCSGQTDFYEYFKENGIDISSGQLEKFWSEFKLGAESTWRTFKTIILIFVILIVLLIVGVVIGVVKQAPAVVGAVAGARRLR